jgi:excisionase family DNA binding protein
MTRKSECQLTMAEAASLLGITVSTLRRWSRDGHIQYLRANPRGDRIFTEEQVAAAFKPKRPGRPRKKMSV